MPPRVVASPKKKQTKRKGLEVSKRQSKKPRAAEPVKTSGTPLMSLRLDRISTDEPDRHSGRANAGTGGGKAQLEKIGALLEALSWVATPPYSHQLLQMFLTPHAQICTANWLFLDQNMCDILCKDSLVLMTKMTKMTTQRGRRTEGEGGEGDAVTSSLAGERLVDITLDIQANDFLGKSFPSQPQVTHPRTPEFEFPISREKMTRFAQTQCLHRSNSSMYDGLTCQYCDDSYLPFQDPLDTLHMQPQSQEVHFSCQFTVVWIWPQQKSNMARLLYNDLATWRSDLKKYVMSLAPQSYSLIPRLRSPSKNVQRPYRIAHRQPDIFHNQLPVSCLALYNCVLNGLAKNGHRKYYPKFTAREYSPIYSKMVQMLKDILQDLYHGPRTASLRVDGAVGAQHDHLQIILD
ncbi:uncharacterized protein F5147DRAFT_658662 [Suillus discolor]|uniref:Uncharacterized protein n=1 Tax=Suillus discolor TaxID=1912936 RepID=A0A9P7JMD3_9AGAM|nr:uncharacterized protein F5147DRAFT_658662 [Suillus discolor]KAG2088693.1 hypothetical protein F5147DRAFT_658662 [Suillus discolor]